MCDHTRIVTCELEAGHEGMHRAVWSDYTAFSPSIEEDGTVDLRPFGATGGQDLGVLASCSPTNFEGEG